VLKRWSHILKGAIVFLALLIYPSAMVQAAAGATKCKEPPARSHTQEFQFTNALEHDSLAKNIPKGAVIGSIRLRRLSVFNLEDPEEDKWLYRLANDFHILTRESVVRSQLLIAEI